MQSAVRLRHAGSRVAAWSLATAFIALALAGCTLVSPLHAQVDRTLAQPDLAGTRWGLMVATLDGDTILAMRPDDRFVPASNTKMFTTAAAFARMGDLSMPDPASGASLRIVPDPEGGAPDLILVGGGDMTLSDRPDCSENCLSSLVEIVIQNRLERVGDIIGDETLFPDERWGPGWSWNNLQTRSGTAVSALVVNGNEVGVEVRPGPTPGATVEAAWLPGDDLWPLVIEAVTVEDGETDLRLERLPGASQVRLYGQVARTAPPRMLAMGIENPALIAATRLRRLLEASGIVVEGEVRARSRPLVRNDDPALRGEGPAPQTPSPGTEIGRLLPPPLAAGLSHTSKVSQNLYAEVLLRRLGLIDGGGSSADGLAVIEAMLDEAGVDRNGWDLADGSGMSTYNRISPRAMIRFLTWTTTQPWGQAWRSTLPIGGVDGTLQRRFVGTSLEGRIFAKTGSLNATNALSGFMLARSGRMLLFSVYANDQPWDAPSAIATMDAALVAIANAN